MAKTYAEIQQEIAQLRKTAASVRQKEVSEVIGRIRRAIEAYGITAQDLGLAAASRGARKAAPKRPAPKAAAYRDEQGNTWSGRGRRPGWIAAALAGGKTLDQLRA